MKIKRRDLFLSVWAIGGIGLMAALIMARINGWGGWSMEHWSAVSISSILLWVSLVRLLIRS